eukprot:Skav219740  [mRNA]  locus=scaffold301:488366:490935:+ [translate_table: standard]
MKTGCVGMQGNDRAELIAVLHALSAFYWVCIVTDSSYAIDVVNKVLNHVPIHAFTTTTNADIIFEIRRVVNNRNHEHIKLKHVKSHQNIRTISDVAAAYEALGNHAADCEAAKVRNRESSGEVITLTGRIKSFDEQHTKHWNKLASFMVAMTKRISDLKHQPALDQPATMTEPTSEGALIQRLTEWTLPGPNLVFGVSVDEDQAQSLPHPSAFVFAVAAWLSRLEWPSEVSSSDVGLPPSLGGNLGKPGTGQQLMIREYGSCGQW